MIFSKKRELAKFGLVGTLKAASTSGVLLFNFLVLKFTDVETASRAMVAITLVFAVTTFFKFGFDGVLLRAVGAAGKRGRIGVREIRVISSFAAMTIVTIFLVLAFFRGGSGGQVWLPYVLVIAALFVLNSMVSSALRGLNMQYLALLIEPGFAIFASSLIYLFSDKSIDVFLALVACYSVLVAVPLFLYLLSKKDKRSDQSVVGLPLKEMLGFWGFDLGNYVLIWASNLVIFWLVAPEAVAQYSLHFRVAMIANFGLVVYNIIRSPDTAKLAGADEITLHIRDIRIDTNWLFLLSASLCAAIALALLSIAVNDDAASITSFEADVPLYLLLSVGFLTNVFFGPVAMLLNMRGHSYEVTQVFLVSAITFIVLAVVGSQIASIFGVASAFVSSQVLQNFLMNRQLKRHFGMGIR